MTFWEGPSDWDRPEDGSCSASAAQLIGRQDRLPGNGLGPDAPPSQNQHESAFDVSPGRPSGLLRDARMQLAPLSTLPRGCWEIRMLRVQNLCFSLAVASRPAGAEARFLFATLSPGERVVGAAKVLLSSDSDGTNWAVEWRKTARCGFHASVSEEKRC